MGGKDEALGTQGLDLRLAVQCALRHVQNRDLICDQVVYLTPEKRSKS